MLRTYLQCSTTQSKATARLRFRFLLFFFNDTATTEIYTLSLHDALPIYVAAHGAFADGLADRVIYPLRGDAPRIRTPVTDRKSTRLNSSHLVISYAVFCLKKKKQSFSNVEQSPDCCNDSTHMSIPAGSSL